MRGRRRSDRIASWRVILPLGRSRLDDSLTGNLDNAVQGNAAFDAHLSLRSGVGAARPAVLATTPRFTTTRDADYSFISYIIAAVSTTVVPGWRPRLGYLGTAANHLFVRLLPTVRRHARFPPSRNGASYSVAQCCGPTKAEEVAGFSTLLGPTERPARSLLVGASRPSTRPRRRWPGPPSHCRLVSPGP